jgi:hypothetical protein
VRARASARGGGRARERENIRASVNKVLNYSSNIKDLKPFAGVLLSVLLKLIAEDDNSLKVLAYSAIGKLGSRVPHLVNKDLALLQTLFEALLQV